MSLTLNEAARYSTNKLKEAVLESIMGGSIFSIVGHELLPRYHQKRWRLAARLRSWITREPLVFSLIDLGMVRPFTRFEVMPFTISVPDYSVATGEYPEADRRFPGEEVDYDCDRC